MQIILRGQKVKTQLISKSLAYIEKDVYKPSFLKNKVTFTFGYNTKSKEQYGIMMYHKNRLIKAYERVGCQLKANNCGVGVIGITECNFLKPTHNKQDFDYTNEYRLTMQALGNKLWDYWKEMKYKRKNDDPFSSVPVEDTVKQPDQNWAQCDECLKWRKLPDGIDTSKLPDNWYCRMNPDTQFRLCSAPEEKEDEDEDHPTYEKTYKREEKINKIKVDHNRQTTMSCQSATSSNLVITDVRSLFAEKNPGPRIKRTLQTNLSRPDVKKLKLNEVQRDLKDAEDPDILIVETKSSPRPSTKADITSVKVEHNDSLENSDMCMEYTDGTVDKSATSMPLQEQHKSITTQTEQKRVLFMKPEAGPYEMKNAKEDEWKKENGIFDSLQEQEKSIETQPKTASQELLNYQKKVADLEQQIIELKEKCVKKEHINQLVQTDSITEYNSLLKLNLNNDQPGEHRPSYEKMLIEMEKLRERCKELETVKQECRKCRLTEDKSFSCKLEDGLAIQPDNIFRKPHSSDEELEKYKEELEAAQQENARIRSECEVLRKHVESMTSRGLTDMGSGSCSTAPPEMTSESMEETIGRLKALRINVGKLLVTYVPALDLEQVNYESDVIDEMLDQILDQVTLTSVS
uniref:MORC family CW-type zinc finger 3 n=1 Tax=Erpetoichthys calabaricus TaxID=27687 RepID=A0A8C4RK02_ERPCA